jgi:hypothetical protein
MNKEKHLKSARRMQSLVIRKYDRLNPEVEKLLIIWKYFHTPQLHMHLNQAPISAKAISLFEMLKNRRNETSKEEIFGTGKG